MKNGKPSVRHRKEPNKQNNYGFQLLPIKKLPIADAMEMLRNAGIDVQEEEAEEIMEFLYTLTQITLKEFFLPD